MPALCSVVKGLLLWGKPGVFQFIVTVRVKFYFE